MSSNDLIPTAVELLQRASNLLSQAVTSSSSNNENSTLRNQQAAPPSRPDPHPRTPSCVQTPCGQLGATVSRPSVISRHRSLFARNTPLRGRSQTMPYGRQTAGGLQRQRPATRRTYSRNIVCLADREADMVPSLDDKVVLQRAGLGEKSLKIPTDASADEVKDIFHEAYPKLYEGGGFEILRTEPHSRSALVVIYTGPCSGEDLKALSSSRLYLRPIQVSISLDQDTTDAEPTSTEQCTICKQQIAVTTLRVHFEECSSTIAESDSESSLPEVLISSDDNQSSSVEVSTDGPASTANTPASTSTTNINDREESIKRIVATMQTTMDPDCSASACLTTFKQMFMEGRKLEPVTAEDMEGQTYQVFISRSSVMNDLLAEVRSDLFIPNVPLCVEFFGEDASDLGGPRRELLRLALREVLDRVFNKEDDGSYVLCENLAFMEGIYRAAGIVFGLCLLQGGPPTSVFSTRLVEDMCTCTSGNSALDQFSHGLRTTGILQLMQTFSQCKTLLMQSAPDALTLTSLLGLFKKSFSEVGSTARQMEESTMSIFVRYLRQLSEGRRIVSLEDVLEFVTGLPTPPVLGFHQRPQIIFEPAASYLPRAVTCTNTLILPIPQQGNNVPNAEFVFDMFDYGFKNAYFGLV